MTIRTITPNSVERLSEYAKRALMLCSSAVVLGDNRVARFYDPWQHAAVLPNLRVHFGQLPHGLLGLTDGRNEVWLQKGQKIIQERCTLTHELLHVEHGHIDGCANISENYVKKVTAWLLVPLRDLADQLREQRPFSDTATALGVTPEVLRDRIRNLRDDELAYIGRVMATLERAS